MNQQTTLYDNVPTEIASESNIIKINTYSIRRTLIMVAFIDFIFQIINGFSFALDNDNDTLPLSYVSFTYAAFILAGICGINRYHSCSSKLYGVYIILRLISYLSFVFYYKLSLFGAIFFILIIILNVWIMKLLCKFLDNLNKLSAEDIDSLKSGWKPNIHTVILI